MLYHGDCLDILPTLESDSVDLVFTSPPYNMNLRVRGDKYCSRQITKELTTKYKNYPDNLPMQDYYEFNRKVISECLRVSPLVFYNVQFLTGNKRAFFKIIGEFCDLIKDIIVWDKVNAQPAIRDNVLNSQFEVIIIFDRNESIARRFSGGNFERGTLSNLWQMKRAKKVSRDHGAVFPIELAERVICNFSKEGGVILDPFLGTGTTALAALSNNRKFVGIEIDSDYFEFSKERIEKWVLSKEELRKKLSR